MNDDDFETAQIDLFKGRARVQSDLSVLTKVATVAVAVTAVPLNVLLWRGVLR